MTFSPLTTLLFSTEPYIQEIKLWSCLFLFLAEAGRLMARYCVAFDTMKQFSKVTGTENLSDLVGFQIRLHSTNGFELNAVIPTSVFRQGSCKKESSCCYMYRLSWCRRAESSATFSWEWMKKDPWTPWTETRTGSPSGHHHTFIGLTIGNALWWR